MSDDELRRVNKRWSSRDWGKFILSKEVIEINLTDKRNHKRKNNIGEKIFKV